MRPAIYDSMNINVEVAENGLIVVLRVFSSTDEYGPGVRKTFVATSNTEALDFIRELSITGVGMLGTDVPTDSNL